MLRPLSDDRDLKVPERIGSGVPAVPTARASGPRHTPARAGGRQRRPAAAALLHAAVAVLGSGEARAQDGIHLRVNQVGYWPGHPVVALALSAEPLAGREYELRPAAGGPAVFRGAVGPDRGSWGRFPHVYELDAGRLERAGRFVLELGSARSPAFEVGRDVATDLPGMSLRFFEVQRCGDTRPRGHGACHREDGLARNGPAAGERVPASGGWHDAGDYIKFLITTGYAAHLMLATWSRHPDAFPDEDGDGVPDALAEARVGLDWIAGLWDAEHRMLYYQVADETDHLTWRLPDADSGPRPVFACEPGRGANVAGKAAASLALAALIWGDSAHPWSDPARAATWREGARQIYEWGRERPDAQPSTPADFYRERLSEDDMALAAVALYRATSEARYLAQARELVRRTGGAALSWGDSSALALYELGRADPAFAAEAAARLRQRLEEARRVSEADPFGVGLERLHWGSAPVLMGLALQALWYEDLTGDAAFLPLGRVQWDYLLGRNPWGVCFVGGAGARWPRRPHHQIADIEGIDLVGFWNEGPVPESTFTGRGIELAGADELAAFQSPAGVYHDDREDYTTNEPTLTANAIGVALTAWYLASR
jgi:hypothetical protein